LSVPLSEPCGASGRRRSDRQPIRRASKQARSRQPCKLATARARARALKPWATKFSEALVAGTRTRTSRRHGEADPKPGRQAELARRLPASSRASQCRTASRAVFLHSWHQHRHSTRSGGGSAPAAVAKAALYYPKLGYPWRVETGLARVESR